MKTKLWLATLAFFAIVTPGRSQGHVPAFQLGVKAGVNISKVDGDAFAIADVWPIMRQRDAAKHRALRDADDPERFFDDTGEHRV